MPVRTAHKPHGLHLVSVLYVKPGIPGLIEFVPVEMLLQKLQATT